MATLQSIINRTELRLSQSAGSAVQTYAEPRIAVFVQDAWISLFERMWWPQYRTYDTVTLDGVTGKPSSPPATIKRFSDIRKIFISGTSTFLPHTPHEINPLLLDGTSARYVEGTAGNRIIQCWPLAATSGLVLLGRAHPYYPDDIALDDDIDMDTALLSLLAAWEYSVDDGNNPAQSEKLMQLFNTRLSSISENLQNMPIELDPRMPNIGTQWQEWPS